jgi:hypothetical protein
MKRKARVLGAIGGIGRKTSAGKGKDAGHQQRGCSENTELVESEPHSVSLSAVTITCRSASRLE